MTLPRRKNPWWIPPLFGRVPADIEERHLRLVGTVSLALLFEEYDLAMLTAALPRIADDLGMPVERLGLDLALIQLGAILTFAVIPFADRIGRRPVFVGSIGAMALFTFLTAFAQTPTQFIVAQALTRTFFVTGSAVSFVIVSEELPAVYRGWGLGLIAALGLAGHGLGAAGFAQIDRLPYGWRALYAFGILPLLLLPYFWRRVAETARFSNQTPHADVITELSGLGALFAPLMALARTRPWRAVGVAVMGFATALAAVPSFRMSGLYTLNKLGWTPGQYSLVFIVAGAMGIAGNIVAGRLGDSIGRKRAGFILLALYPLSSFAFYQSRSWVAVIVAWIGVVFFWTGGRVIQRALATELFPTSHRGAATGMFFVLETLGGAAGLLLVFLLGTKNIDAVSVAAPTVALAIYVAAFVMLMFPETRHRELEEIS